MIASWFYGVVYGLFFVCGHVFVYRIYMNVPRSLRVYRRFPVATGAYLGRYYLYATFSNFAMVFLREYRTRDSILRHFVFCKKIYNYSGSSAYTRYTNCMRKMIPRFSCNLFRNVILIH